VISSTRHAARTELRRLPHQELGPELCRRATVGEAPALRRHSYPMSTTTTATSARPLRPMALCGASTQRLASNWLPPWTDDQQQLRTGCWMRRPLPVRAGGAGAGLGLGILIACQAMPAALLRCDQTSHELNALAAAHAIPEDTSGDAAQACGAHESPRFVLFVLHRERRDRKGDETMAESAVVSLSGWCLPRQGRRFRVSPPGRGLQAAVAPSLLASAQRRR
jgi:hypothetical protein